MKILSWPGPINKTTFHVAVVVAGVLVEIKVADWRDHRDYWAESVGYRGKGGLGHDWRDHRDYWAKSVGYREEEEEEGEEEGGGDSQ